MQRECWRVCCRFWCLVSAQFHAHEFEYLHRNRANGMQTRVIWAQPGIAVRQDARAISFSRSSLITHTWTCDSATQQTTTSRWHRCSATLRRYCFISGGGSDPVPPTQVPLQKLMLPAPKPTRGPQGRQSLIAGLVLGAHVTVANRARGQMPHKRP